LFCEHVQTEFVPISLNQVGRDRKDRERKEHAQHEQDHASLSQFVELLAHSRLRLLSLLVGDLLELFKLDIVFLIFFRLVRLALLLLLRHKLGKFILLLVLLYLG
jgi:hypothetical protein